MISVLEGLPRWDITSFSLAVLFFKNWGLLERFALLFWELAYGLYLIQTLLPETEKKREAANVFNIGEDASYRWLRRAKTDDLKPKKGSEFPRKVSDKTLGAYVREHPDRTFREISQAVGLAISNVQRHFKKWG